MATTNETQATETQATSETAASIEEKVENNKEETNVWKTLADSMTPAFISLKLDSLF